MSHVKDDLMGRVVGFEIPYTAHPSQARDEHDTLARTSTRWGRVSGTIIGEDLLVVEPLHGMPVGISGNCWNLPADLFHTVMPESYAR